MNLTPALGFRSGRDLGLTKCRKAEASELLQVRRTILGQQEEHPLFYIKRRSEIVVSVVVRCVGNVCTCDSHCEKPRVVLEGAII